jgi:hypothetical protein
MAWSEGLSSEVRREFQEAQRKARGVFSRSSDEVEAEPAKGPKEPPTRPRRIVTLLARAF